MLERMLLSYQLPNLLRGGGGKPRVLLCKMAGLHCLTQSINQTSKGATYEKSDAFLYDVIFLN